MKHDGAYTAPFRRYACGNGCCGQGEHLCAQQNNNAKENQERIIRTVTSRTDGKTALFKTKNGLRQGQFIWGLFNSLRLLRKRSTRALWNDYKRMPEPRTGQRLGRLPNDNCLVEPLI